MKTRIHVNGHHIRMNKKDGKRRPVFTAKDYRQNRKGNYVEIRGPSALVYPGKALNSGAVAWIETQAEVVVR